MSMKVILVTGDRKLEDKELVEKTIAQYAPDLVIVGDCPTGVDRITRNYCNRIGLAKLPFYADWDDLGLAAGPERNGRMVAQAVREAWEGATVTVVAFPRGGPGTRDCMKQAKTAGLRVEEY